MPAFRLKLDHDRVFWGVEMIESAALADADDVVLDHEPDNQPGAYRWDAEARALLPLPPSKIKVAQNVPTLEQAVHALVKHLRHEGHALPTVVREWAEAFTKTIEG